MQTKTSAEERSTCAAFGCDKEPREDSIYCSDEHRDEERAFFAEQAALGNPYVFEAGIPTDQLD